MAKRRVYRFTEGKMIAGVCTGLARYFDTDPTWVRLIFVISIFFHGLGLIAYLVAWIVIPRWPENLPQPEAAPVAPPPGSPEQPAESMTAMSPEPPPVNGNNNGHSNAYLPGLILIALGVIFFFAVNFDWFQFRFIWPIVLIALGAVLLFRAIESNRRTDEVAVNGEVTNEGR